MARADQGLELLAELLDVADVGADRAVVEGADGGAGAALGHVQDRVEVLLAALSVHDPVRHLVDPAGGLAAGRALPARLVRVEARHHHQGLRDRDRLVHHDHARGADHGAGRLEAVGVHAHVDLVGGEDRGRRAAGHHRLQAPPVADAAAVVVDERAQGHRHRRLHHARLHHVARHRVEPGPALGLGAEPGEPLGAPVDDVGHRRDGLHVVHDGGLPEGALDRGERRLDLGPALLALEGGEQARLLAADVGARPAMDHDVEVEARALDVPAEQPRVVGFLHRAAEHLPRLHVLAPDVDEPDVRVDRPRRDDHALDQGVGIALEQVAVLERARLALVRVDHEVLRRGRALGDEAPLHAGGEGGAAEAAEVGLLDLLGDRGGLHRERLGQRGVSAGLAVDAQGVRVRPIEVAGEDQLGHQESPSRMRSTFSGVSSPS